MTSSNMTCEAFSAALPDYLEDTLDDSLRDSVEMHLRECVRCASVVRDIENIRKEAAALPDLVPARDLWEGIEARIAAAVIPLATRPERQRRFAPAWMGVAAAALVVSTAGITYLLTARLLHSGAEASQGAANQMSVPARLASRDQQSAPTHSDMVYGKEIAMLQRIVSERKTQLDSSTVAIIEKNLQIIDAAIEQSRAALAKDPASLLLSEQLTHALDKKVELLRTAALLPAST